MKERHLIGFCAAGFSVCVIVLYFLGNSMDYSVHVNIGSIGKDMAGKEVNITGKVSSMRRSGGNVFFDLYDETGKVKVVLWNSTLELLRSGGIDLGEIKNGKEINVIGSVELYRGEPEVIPSLDHVKFV